MVVYNDSFFSLSETFIWEQVQVLRSHFDIKLLGNKVENATLFPLDDLQVHLVDRCDAFPFRQWNRLRRRLQIYTPIETVEGRQITHYLRTHQPKLVHAHFGYNGLKLMPILKKLKIPLVVSFHGIDASERIYSQPKYNMRLPKLLDYASAIIVVSSHMIETLKIIPGNLKKTHLIPYSVDSLVFDANISERSMGNSIRILHSGRLVQKKGVPDLIRVFNELAKINRNIELHVLGSGEEEVLSRQLVRDFGIGSIVHFYGGQPHSKVKELMMLCDIFVLNSRVADNGDMEGTPVSLLEAMSMRMAVLSTYHAGIPKVVANHESGLLVEERNNASLKSALQALISDAALRIKLGENARKAVIRNYGKARLEEQLCGVYSSVI